MEIILIAAVTLDGKIARSAAHLSNWTSREDKRVFREETRRAGVVILGHNTFKTLPRPLPGRLHIVLTRDPAAQAPIPGAVEFTAAAPAAIAADLAARGYARAALVGGAQTNAAFLAADLVDDILARLGAADLRRRRTRLRGRRLRPAGSPAQPDPAERRRLPRAL